MTGLGRALWITASPLRRARRAAHLTARAVGELTGLKDNTIRAYERGIRRPEVAVITKIASAAGLNPAVVMLDHQCWLSMNPTEGMENECDTGRSRSPNDERSESDTTPA